MRQSNAETDPSYFTLHGHRRQLGYFPNPFTMAKKAATSAKNAAVRGAKTVSRGVSRSVSYVSSAVKSAVKSIGGTGTYDVDKKKTWDLFNFNYNTQSRKAKIATKTLYKKGSSSRGIRIYCKNCYAYLSAGFRFECKIKAGLRGVSVDMVRSYVDGAFKTNFDVEGKANYK
jgi:hypothetical protein